MSYRFACITPSGAVCGNRHEVPSQSNITHTCDGGKALTAAAPSPIKRSIDTRAPLTAMHLPLGRVCDSSSDSSAGVVVIVRHRRAYYFKVITESGGTCIYQVSGGTQIYPNSGGMWIDPDSGTVTTALSQWYCSWGGQLVGVRQSSRSGSNTHHINASSRNAISNMSPFVIAIYNHTPVVHCLC